MHTLNCPKFTGYRFTVPVQLRLTSGEQVPFALLPLLDLVNFSTQHFQIKSHLLMLGS